MSVVGRVRAVEPALCQVRQSLRLRQWQFPWVADIEKNWAEIRSELDRVLLRRSELPNIQDITKDAKSITVDSGWKIFLFVAYGIESKLNIELCPQTWRAVKRQFLG